ncbi:replication initiation protein [Loktanella sp. TSTF-M6]|uniref:Replication initiation protein n=1 Tax=Loktanella gaetbuli TaxID=2881335 RepID=A0ABS8BYN0_9RHOB|nr:replication initiation protein [Loktanella gaetbuli]MCB5200845.1 replication initiation protein [Loktanella gaetbuli]
MTKLVRTLDAIQSRSDDPDAIVEAGELVDMRFPSGGHMSLRGGKLFHLLVQAAGVDVAEDVTHRITLASLNDTFHIAVPELVELVDELHTTTLKLKLTDAKGRRYTKSGPILSDVEREDESNTQAELRFQFSPTMRKAIANSSHWAVVSKRAVLAFESRYSLRLYTVLSLRAGLRKTSEDFALDDLREILGVPAGKLGTWKNLRLRALDPAIAEINQLAGFHAGFVPLKRGRRVVGVTLTWGLKDRTARVEALKELDRPKVGRKARRDGSADMIVEAEGRQREALATALSAAGAQGHGQQD